MRKKEGNVPDFKAKDKKLAHFSDSRKESR
jgi:hypothetical protein